MTLQTPKAKPVKYLSNKELLAEIHRCKTTYCEYLDKQYADFDFIVNNLDDVTPKLIDEYLTKYNAKLDPENQKTDEALVVRLMTYEHIPLDLERKRKSKEANQFHAKTNFPPFKHFLIKVVGEGKYEFSEVGRSHWEGGFQNGHFSPERGRMSERLGYMFMMLVEKYARRGNWRGYSYRDEMMGMALTQLSRVGLQFDESKSQNPFAFFTTTITHCFTRTLNLEKRSQSIRDDLLIHYGMAPSYTRQIENEMAQSGLTEPKPLPSKRGRKTVAQRAAEKEAEKPIE